MNNNNNGAWQLKPGVSWGPFHIGALLSYSIEFIRMKAMEFGDVKMSYNDREPLHSDITVTIAKLCVRLRFDPHTQRLKSIDVYDLTRVAWSYEGTVFHQSAATVASVTRVFGPTFPQVPLPNTQQALIVYPGVCFVARSQAAPSAASGDDVIIQRILIMHATAMYDDLRLPQPQNLEYERVEARVGEGIYFTERKESVAFDSTPQEVMSVLGTPDGRTPKTVQLTKIHSSDATSSGGGGATGSVDYWFNYFHIGVDVLFDGTSHGAKKFILHSNFPGHPEFCRYRKCNYSVKPLAAATDSMLPPPPPPPPSSSLLLSAVRGENSIHVDMKWDDIVAIMGSKEGPHLVHIPNGPFAPSKSYAYNGIIFEVIATNGHQASVTLSKS